MFSGKDYNMNKVDIPDLKLEQYLLGELDTPEMEKITALCSNDEQVQNRVESLRHMEKVFTDTYTLDWFQQRITQKNIQQSKPKHSFRLALVPIVCILLLLPLAYFYLNMSNNLDSSLTRTKGDLFFFTVYRKTALGHDLLPNGSVVREKDLLQIEYTADTSLHYGLIVSLDGNGHITIHLGDENGSAAQLTERNKLLPYSYELDDAPGFEKFFYITGRNQFTLNDCISICKKMDKRFCKTTRFSIKMLTLNKVSILE
jgi:hypothetical protein